MGRYYDIELSCGCLISLDKGGGCIPCNKEDCKYDEEYETAWLTETQINNNVV